LVKSRRKQNWNDKGRDDGRFGAEVLAAKQRK
jgi:hypothetical protein